MLKITIMKILKTGEKETANVSTTANPSICKSSSLKQEESECISFTNTPSTVDPCQTVLGGEYYIHVFNTHLMVSFNIFAYEIYLIKSYGAKFNFEHQVDGSYLIYVKNNMTKNYFLHVNGSSLYGQLSDASTPVNLTYYFLEYQPEGTFRIKVKSLDHYIATSGLFLSLTNDAYGENAKFLIETARPAWDVIFRIPIGSPYNIYKAFLYGTKQLMTNSCEVNTYGTCNYSFTRNDDKLRAWWNGYSSVCKIKFSVIVKELASLDFVFDGVNTSPETWFVARKLQRSNYYTNITGLSLTAAESEVRYFLIRDARIQKNICSAYYDPNSPYRRLSIIALGTKCK
ncbi:hypothetical protein CHS0354_026695 [Potamilus streckersoni]|uniref:Uncharacterized protein n=1 Tax=Potamilus streckersoni TaxID=2493646 RepID=A0AAE0VQZ2_9BIVA|nr:hypothetical protein CHS0354_026695 [Potamilus streckersoni]